MCNLLTFSWNKIVWTEFILNNINKLYEHNYFKSDALVAVNLNQVNFKVSNIATQLFALPKWYNERMNTIGNVGLLLTHQID